MEDMDHYAIALGRLTDSLVYLFWRYWYRQEGVQLREYCALATSTAMTCARLRARWFETLQTEDVDEELEREMVRVFGQNMGYAMAANLLAGYKVCNTLSVLVRADRNWLWWPFTRPGWSPPVPKE